MGATGSTERGGHDPTEVVATTTVPAGRIDARSNDRRRAEALAAGWYENGVGAFEWLTVYLGLRLGLYDGLVAGPATAAQLAQRAEVHARYVREWLEQQSVCGLVDVEDPAADAEARVYRLPPATAAMLCDPGGTATVDRIDPGDPVVARDRPAPVDQVAADGPSRAEQINPLGPLGLMIGGIAGVLPALVDAFRTGDGVPYAAYGDDLRAGQSQLNRQLFADRLAQEWIPALPDLRARLLADEPARVADVGCGAGWSSIALARAFPRLRVDGFDLDEASVGDARRNAAEEDVADRVRFEVADAAGLPATGDYDLVCAFDVVASLPRPVEALQAMRALCRPTGAVLVMEWRCRDDANERGGTDDQNELDERLLYALSVLHGLPVAAGDQPPAATGAVPRVATLAGCAVQAGFTDIQTLPIDDSRRRFFRLTP